VPRIQVLDERTANQIAAGEVVERPASVVKELVENSLDAGSTRIVVEVEGGGRDLIRVLDDGSGMSPEDARLSLQRHATSKIRTAEDLHLVATMGFRGEALPSIASVSRFELITRERDQLAGYRIYVEGGTVAEEAEHGCPPGTRITVRDLFYNTPARLKYLKTSATEMGQVGDILTRLAMANPGVSIRFHSGQTQVFATPGTGSLMDAVTGLLGREMAKELMPVDYRDGAARVWGFVGRPGAARAGRNHQYFFVNRRAIRTIQVRYALEEAYAHLLPTGRYPICVLFIEVDPAEVDVNVHPTKAEVRFERERDVRGAVYKATRQTLGAHLLIPGTTVSPDGEVSVPDRAGENAAVAARRAGVPEIAVPGPTAGTDGPRQVSLWSSGANTNQRVMEAVTPFTLPPGGLQAALDQRFRGGAAAPDVPGDEPPLPAAVGPSTRDLIRSLRPMGQVHQSYIICDGPEGLYVVDQHAAHERINFEKLLAAAERAAARVQPLLFPITLDLTPAQLALWQENASIFAESGFDARPFGGTTLLISGVPSSLGEAHVARLVCDFLDKLQEDRVPPGTAVLDRRRRVLAAMAACKASIKAKDALQPEDVAALMNDLADCQSPHTCPHGRPTIICVTIGELEKRFKR
jgi:DNA mismatch repair protein MutL